MNFDEVVLTLPKSEARDRISDRVSGLRVKTEDGRISYRTNSGIVVAVLSDTDLGSGETGSKLRYRTAMISPSLSHARRKGRKIRRVVEEYRAN